MNVKTTILASLFLGIGLFPIHAEKPITESMIVQQAKRIRVSGTVLDKEKNPLPGVNVTVKNATGGTITDIDGHFYVEVPNKQSVLMVTYIGFKTKEIVVGNEISFNIILEEDVEALDEVMVVGYGNQKKLSVIGSVQTLEPTKLQVGSSRSLSNNLAGQLAGVIAIQPSGEPGYDNSNFWIRGI
ncbi:MAG TPA: carboxypeptidase-like regulatory domain-containing protein, partial [Bacteroides reticulotermitis]|nr:carboxypeptidase-like regulatory domain-containing protein [Bacteroides reticulotermitis]